jgi:nuclear pore complex protein Nup133
MPQPQTYLVSTSFGRLFRLTLVSSGGRHHFAAHAFSRPNTGLSLASLIPGLWASPVGVIPTKGNASAVTLGASTPTGQDVWALVETRVQRWNMSVEGWEEPTLDEELGSIIRPVIHTALPSAPSDDSALDLELLDFAFERQSLINSDSGKMVILVSYAVKEEPTAVDLSDPRRSYALVRVSYASGAFTVETVNSVPYQSVRCSYHQLFSRLIMFIILPDINLWCSYASPITIDTPGRLDRDSVWRRCGVLRSR